MAKKTPNQIAYQKEVKRIERFLKNAQNKGYTFTQLPSLQMPKRVTKKRLEQIKAVKPAALYKKATYREPGGMAIPANVHRAEVRKAAARKAAETRLRKVTEPAFGAEYGAILTSVVLDNVRAEIERWAPDSKWKASTAERKERDKNLVERILNAAIDKYGGRAVANQLEAHADEVIDIVQKALYLYRDEDVAQAAIVRFAMILNGDLTREENEDLTEYSELI